MYTKYTAYNCSSGYNPYAITPIHIFRPISFELGMSVDVHRLHAVSKFESNTACGECDILCQSCKICHFLNISTGVPNHKGSAMFPPNNLTPNMAATNLRQNEVPLYC